MEKLIKDVSLKKILHLKTFTFVLKINQKRDFRERRLQVGKKETTRLVAGQISILAKMLSKFA